MKESLGQNPEFIKREGELQKIVTGIQDIVSPHGIAVDWRIDPLSYNLATRTPRPYTDETFAFRGRIAPNGNHLYKEVGVRKTAVIEHVRLPVTLRGQGMGAAIVTEWEKYWQGLGVTSFTAQSIHHTQGALNFWKQMGYEIPRRFAGEEYPRFMYKRTA